MLSVRTWHLNRLETSALLLFGTAFLLAVAAFFRVVIDDAYISCRYAVHLASGAGLTFNPGERVEGFSNPLFVLLLALGERLGLSAITGAKVLGLAATLSLLALVAGAFMFAGAADKQRRMLSGLACIVVLPTLALAAPTVFWSVAGLETPFYTLLLFAGFFLAGLEGQSGLRKWGDLSSVALAGAALCRPEGLMFAFALYGALLVPRFLSRTTTSAPHYLWLVRRLTIIGLLVAPYLLFRWAYFGTWLPNTYFAKVSKSDSLVRGWRYLVDQLANAPGAFLLATAALALGLALSQRLDRSRLRPWVFGASAMAAAQLFFIGWSGGDWMPAGRFVLPLLPFLGFLSLIGIRFALAKVKRRRLALVVLLSLSCATGQALGLRQTYKDYYWRIAHGLDSRIALGKWMKNGLPSHYTVAYGDMGALPLHSGLRFIDMNGLTDRTIGALRYRARKGLLTRNEQQYLADSYVLERQPELIILVTHTSPALKRPVGNGRLIHKRPEFREKYQLAGHLTAYLPGIVPAYPKGRHLLIYAREGTETSKLKVALARVNAEIVAAEDG